MAMMQSSPINLRRAVIWIGRLVIAAFFIYAGYAKIFLPIMHPRPPIRLALSFFAMQVDSYQLLAPWAVSFVAHTLPFAEIALGLLLLVGLATSHLGHLDHSSGPGILRSRGAQLRHRNANQLRLLRHAGAADARYGDPRRPPRRARRRDDGLRLYRSALPAPLVRPGTSTVALTCPL